jgi:hypothetical protein
MIAISFVVGLLLLVITYYLEKVLSKVEGMVDKVTLQD